MTNLKKMIDTSPAFVATPTKKVLGNYQSQLNQPYLAHPKLLLDQSHLSSIQQDSSHLEHKNLFSHHYKSNEQVNPVDGPSLVQQLRDMMNANDLKLQSIP